MAKPPKLPRWASEDVIDPVTGKPNVQEPPESKKDRGWDRREVPPRQWVNWLHRTMYEWLLWLRDATWKPTPGTLMERDENGRSQVADPVAEEDIVNKRTLLAYFSGDLEPDEVLDLLARLQAIEDGLAAHMAHEQAHNATVDNIPNRIVLRDANGKIPVEQSNTVDPTAASNLAALRALALANNNPLNIRGSYTGVPRAVLWANSGWALLTTTGLFHAPEWGEWTLLFSVPNNTGLSLGFNKLTNSWQIGSSDGRIWRATGAAPTSWTESTFPPTGAVEFLTPHQNGSWMCIADQKLWRSADGTTWTDLGNPFANAPSGPYESSNFPRCLVRAGNIEEATAPWVVAGNGGRVARSTDGINWSVINVGVPNDRRLMYLAYGEHSYADDGDGKLYGFIGGGYSAISTDRGVTWTVHRDPATEHAFWEEDNPNVRFHFMRYCGGAIMVGSDMGHLFISADGKRYRIRQYKDSNSDTGERMFLAGSNMEMGYALVAWAQRDSPSVNGIIETLHSPL